MRPPLLRARVRAGLARLDRHAAPPSTEPAADAVGAAARSTLGKILTRACHAARLPARAALGLALVAALGPACAVQGSASASAGTTQTAGTTTAGATGGSAPGPGGATPNGGGIATGTPQSEAECRACNGDWGVHGISQIPSCNCRTTDGGKTCRDGADCQGLCIADENPQREVSDAGPPPRGFFLGQCSPYKTMYGCFRLLERGAAERGPVDLAELPQMMCID
jgi:hypothetical protein